MAPDLASQIRKLERTFPPLSPERAELVARASRELAGSGITERVLKAGGLAPDFTLPNAVGVPVSLGETLRNGPAVVTFYRGIWCPYCNLQLKAYQRVLPEILRRGVQLLAISPQDPDKSQATLLKNFLKYEVLSDAGNGVSRRFGLVYQVPEWIRSLYVELGTDLPAFNGDHSWELPLAGTFVIDRNRRIVFAFADSDPSVRCEPDAILAALQPLS